MNQDDPIALGEEPDFPLGAMLVRPAAREVVQADTTHRLEPRVMQALIALAQASGAVVSRDQLIARCWAGVVVGEDAINRVMSRVRRLAEIEPIAFDLETIPRVGYRLTARTYESAVTQSAAASLAVLPFVNLSSDPEQDYFSDGLAEELIAQLARLADLRVTGRTSSFAFKGRNEDVREIGRTLGVSHVLEGGVRKAGTRLRITAQLVQCSDGYRVWSQSYDRDLGDVFEIQEEVARAVTSALGVTLGIDARANGTANFDAYDAFLRGRFLPGEPLSGSDFVERANHLRQATVLDPRYALAWANLANLIAFHQAMIPAHEALALDDERDNAAEQALQCGPDLAIARIASAWRAADQRDWPAAEAGFAHALATSYDPQAEGIFGAYLVDVGRVREGLAYRLTARAADPLSIGWCNHVLGGYLALGMWERFDAEYERSRALPGQRAQVEQARLARLMAADAPERREFAMASGEMSPAQFTHFLEDALGAAAAALSDGAIAFVCMDWRHIGELTAAGEAVFNELKNVCVWTKSNGGMGSLYRSQHELVFVFKKGTGAHVNNVELGRHGRNRTNVWTYAGASAFGANRAGDLAMHPTVKPVALVEDALKDVTRRGDLVLDPFGGSGSTLIAAQKCGRSARLIELDPLYCDVIVERFQRYTGKTALRECDGATFEDIAPRAAEAAR